MTAFSSLVGEGKVLVTRTFSFCHSVFYFIIKRIFISATLILICHLEMLSIWSCPKFCHLVKGLTFLKQALDFACLQYESSKTKTRWEKEKLLIMSNFSFSYSVFYPFGELSAVFIECEIVICKLFEFGRV